MPDVAAASIHASAVVDPSARIGEGLIFDLRVRLFDHVSAMPIAFFTRTQTGKLVSRVNNDVIGAQQAFTSTLSTVVSNVIRLVLVLGAMIVLGHAEEWWLQAVGFIAVVAGAANVFGGFVVTDRMLEMFKRKPGAGR